MRPAIRPVPSVSAYPVSALRRNMFATGSVGEAARTDIQRYTTDEIVRSWEDLFTFLER